MDTGSGLIMAGGAFKNEGNNTFSNEMHEHDQGGAFTFLSFSCLSLI